jgi:cytochrome P450
MQTISDQHPTETQQAVQPNKLRAYEDLPGPRGLPFFGNALQLDLPRMHQQLEQWSHEFGPMFKLKVPGRRLLLVSNHETVATVLRDRPDGFSRPRKLEEIWVELGLPVGLFVANGDVWKRQRRMVMAGFDPTHVKNYYPAMVGVSARLSARWQRAAAAGQAIDLQPDLMRYTVDTIAGLAFGAGVDTLSSDGDVIQQHLDQIFPALYDRLYKPLPVWRWLPSKADKHLAHSIKQVNLAVDGFIAEARARLALDAARRAEPPNLLEAMIVAADEPASGMDDHQVAGNVLTMLLAGEDTTANTLAWMLYLMWQNPGTLAKAIAEVQRVVGNSTSPTLEQMAQLEYVEACAHETMRLKPVAPILAGQALRDLMVGDVRVPKGVVVTALMRRDSVSDTHIPNASAFEPERWLANADTAPSAATTANSAKRISMPFGAGPRICPGRYLALLEMKLAIATVLRDFDITSVDTADGRPAQEVMKFAMAPEGLRMRLKLKAREAAIH